jgi:hypothetical protein
MKGRERGEREREREKEWRLQYITQTQFWCSLCRTDFAYSPDLMHFGILAPLLQNMFAFKDIYETL